MDSRSSRRDLAALALLVAVLPLASACGGESAQGQAKLHEIPPGSRLPAAISADRVNVRPGPGADPPLGTLSKGARVVVRRRDGAWLEIDYPAELGLWVARRYVKALSGESEAELDRASEKSPVRASAARDRVQVRSLPSTRGAVVAELSRGDEISVTGVFNDWCRASPQGPGPLSRLVAYVHSDYVDVLPEPAPAAGSPQPAGSPEAPAHSRQERDPAPAQDPFARAEALIGSTGPNSLADARAALELLDEALSASSGAELERARSRAAAILGAVPPAKWLSLLELASSSRVEQLEPIDRRLASELRDARDALQETPPVEFTARGTLRASGGAGPYRLMRGETALYELSPTTADLAPFAGKEVGVIGEVTEPRREGGLPRISVRYVEELGR